MKDDKLKINTPTSEVHNLEKMLDTVKETVRHWLSENQCQTHAIFTFEPDGSLRLDFPALVLNEEVRARVEALDGMTMHVSSRADVPDLWSVRFSPLVDCQCAPAG